MVDRFISKPPEKEYDKKREIIVSSEGEGIKNDHLPFFTTLKPPAQGHEKKRRDYLIVTCIAF